MKALTFLLRRYLFPKEGNLLTLGLWVSILGVVVGIVQLMVVLSVMTGFQRYLKNSYTRITSDLVVRPVFDEGDPDLDKKISGVSGVRAVARVAWGQAMLINEGVAGTIIEGLDYESSQHVIPWEEVWVNSPDWELQKREPHWIWLGAQLAKKLKLKTGDTVKLFIPGRKEAIPPFRVTAITRFGIYDHDLRYAYMSYASLRELLGATVPVSLYRVALDSHEALDPMAKKLSETLGSRVDIRRWSEVHRNLFLAVEHQKKMLFLVLEIIVALAGLNIANLLMMSSHHRRRDVAILRAMGMRFGSVFSFFVLQGAVVGLMGIGLGIVAGYFACHLVERFQPTLLQESVYNVTRLPIEISARDVGLIAGVAFLLCVLFSVMPALRAALARPVAALRNE